MTGNPESAALQEAEPIGQKGYLEDVMVIAPCTGNCPAKLANAITDTAVQNRHRFYAQWQTTGIPPYPPTMHWEPVLKIWEVLHEYKTYLFCAIRHRIIIKKPNSMVAKMELSDY